MATTLVFGTALSLAGFHGLSATVACATAGEGFHDAYTSSDKTTRRQHFFKGSVYLAKMASHIAAAIASADEEENVILQRRGQVTFKDLLTLTVSDAVLSLPRQLVAIEVVWNACEAISELVFDGSSLFIWSRFVISFYGLTVLLVQRSSPVSPSGTPPPSSLAPS